LDSVATMYILISSRIFFVIDLNLMIEQRPTKVVLTSVAGFKLRLLYWLAEGDWSRWIHTIYWPAFSEIEP
jgi:hypothetical protein